MKYRILIITTFLCWLGGLSHAYAQVPTAAPKTTSSTPSDTLRTVEILPGAKKLQIKKVNDTTELQILVGNVRLRQGTTLFMCDSCIINNNQHIFEAFGNVHINDSDTANIYSDYMRYLTQTKIAYFKDNVKLTDGKGELTTPEMEYDMNTKIGIYTKGGKVKNKKTVLTSDEGYYYADLKDVYFKKNVIMKDPSYDLRTDSLLYSTAFETARFISKTLIIDSNKRQITTSDGYYDLKNGKAQFGKRPVIVDGKMTITGNDIAIDDSTGIFQARGSAIVVDSTQGTITMADEIFHNRNTGAVLATKKPIMIIKQDNDSIYVSADTLFSARLTDLYSRPESFKKDSVVRDSTIAKDSLTIPDSANSKIPVASPATTALSDTLLKRDSTAIADTLLRRDSLQQQLPPLTDSLKGIDTTTQVKLPAPVVDSALNKIPAITTGKKPGGRPRFQSKDLRKPTQVLPANEKAIAKTTSPGNLNSDSTGLQKDTLLVRDTLKGLATLDVKKGDSTGLQRDTLLVKDTLKDVTTIDVKEGDSTNRYFEAYSHVRIFSDSMQAVADSMFYSFKDSVFRLFKDPILWANGSQVTGDTIRMFTKNKKAERLEVVDNSLMVNNVEKGKDVYNQVKSSRMDAYFVDGNIDSVRAKGSAECIYYLQDKDSAYTGINQSNSDIMDIYFKNKELNRVVFRSQVKGTLWPIKQKSPSEMRLPNFRWLEERRPKTKYELFE